MKPHPKLTSAAIVAEMLKPGAIETVKAVGRVASPGEVVEAQEALRTALADMATKVKTICAGCGQAYPILDTTPCVCGQFVCAGCAAVEQDGVCEHDPSPMDALDTEDQ